MADRNKHPYLIKEGARCTITIADQYLLLLSTSFERIFRERHRTA